MAAEVNLPVVGGVPKKALLIGGGAAALLVAVLFLKRKKAAAAPASTAGTASSGDPYPPDGTTGDPGDPNSTDPATGMTYGDEQAGTGTGGYQDTAQGPDYGATGYYDPNTGQWVYGNTGTGQAAATTNQAWAQDAISYLSGTGTDPGQLSAALGAYLAGQPVTPAQVSLIDEAIAAEGYPPQAGPNNYPPGINESGAGTGQGGTAGSTGGVTGSGTGSTGPVVTPPAPGGGSTGQGSGSGSGSSGGSSGSGSSWSGRVGMVTGVRVTDLGKTGVGFTWTGVPGSSAYVCLCKRGGSNGTVINGPFTVTSARCNFGGLQPGTAYTAFIWPSTGPDPGGPGSNQPHAEYPFKTPK